MLVSALEKFRIWMKMRLGKCMAEMFQIMGAIHISQKVRMESGAMGSVEQKKRKNGLGSTAHERVTVALIGPSTFV